MIVALVAYISLAALCIIMLIRSKVAAVNCIKISDAIHAYGMDKINRGDLIEADNAINYYSQMESYNKTMLRLWDFGYKNILPKEIYKKIEPYISK